MPSDIEQSVITFRGQLLRNERKAASKMVRVYGRSWQRIRREIDRTAKQVRKLEAEGQSASALIYRQQRLNEIRNQVEAQLRRFAQYAETSILREQAAAVKAAANHAEQLVLAGLGEIPPGVRIVVNKLPTIAIENMIATLQAGSPLRQLLERLAGEGAQAVYDGLLNGLILGQGAPTIARSIRAALGGNMAKALQIARTETIRAYHTSAHQGYQANSDLVKGWYWRSARNERTCAMCWAMDGTFHTLDESIDDHIAGRCYEVPVTKTWAELGYPDIPESVKPKVTGVEAFNGLRPDQQLRILGPAKYRAWLDGKITLPDLIGRRYDPRWGWMRYEKSLKELGIDWRSILPKPSVLKAEFADVEERLVSLGKTLVTEMERLTGAASQWKGIVQAETGDGWAGVKHWKCTIGIDKNYLRSAMNTGNWNDVNAILVHELFHSVSNSVSPLDYVKYRGLEEGVVEQMQRLFGPGLLRNAGQNSYASQWAYNNYIRNLEKLRLATQMDANDFYHELIKVPLAKRQSYIYNKIVERYQAMGLSEGRIMQLIDELPFDV